MQQKIIDNKITSLFMGEIDFQTGKWFPIKKMTWDEKQNQNYLNCSISFTEGAKIYQSLYPNLKNLFAPSDINRVMKYKDVLKCAWHNRMPIARPLEEKLKISMGLDTGSVDPVEFVARDGGYRHGDLCDIFPEVTPNKQGNYNFIFRSIDTWVMVSNNKPELETIPMGAKVTLQPSEKTEILPEEWEKPMIEPPPETLRMKMYIKDQMVGYAPNYIKELYRYFEEQLKVEIFQVNLGVPFEYQFLFLATLNQDVGVPFSQPEYQLVSIKTSATN